MKYLGYTITSPAGWGDRYTVYAPDGARIGSFGDAAAARRWVREHRAAAKAREQGGDGAR